MRKLLLALLVAVCWLGSDPLQAFAVKVVVDAGHGGSDPGAIGVNGLQEKDVNLDIASKLRDELARRGYDAVLSRTDDRYISLQERVDFTAQEKADLFVSVHSNWYQNPSTRGTMVLYYDDAYPQSSYPASSEMKALTPIDRKFAQSVENSVLAAAGTVDKGLTPSSVFVVRMGKVPSILVETAFLSNSDDAALLADEAFRSKVAIGIANGIEAFRPAIFPDLAGHWARDAIMRLKSKGIVQGESDLFAPDQALTRAEFVTMLDRIFSFSQSAVAPAASAASTTGSAVAISVTPPASACSGSSVTGAVYGSGCTPPLPLMTDLSPTHWAYTTMRRALELGLLQGYPDGTVRPNQPISREEAAVLLDRMMNGGPVSSPPGSSPLVFTDVPQQGWSAAAIARLYAKGIVSGVADGRFAPGRSITRAEICVMLDRYLSAKP